MYWIVIFNPSFTKGLHDVSAPLVRRPWLPEVAQVRRRRRRRTSWSELRLTRLKSARAFGIVLDDCWNGAVVIGGKNIADKLQNMDISPLSGKNATFFSFEAQRIIIIKKLLLTWQFTGHIRHFTHCNFFFLLNFELAPILFF